MIVKRATSVLFVDRVEPTRDFFKRVGFEVIAEVPAGASLGFVILQKDGVQVMVETRGNQNEPAAIQAITRESRRAAVFVEVDDLDAVIGALAGSRVIVERHLTFYKSDELTYEEPGGNIVTFARFA